MTNSKTSFLSTFLFTILFSFSNISPANAATSYNVIKYGAKPNGVKDSTEGFLSAWSAACASEIPAVMYVPKGRYLLRPLVFKGDCNSTLTLRIDGTLVAPTNYKLFEGFGEWISFEFVSNVSVLGGRLDARGPALWACKLAKGSAACPPGVRTLSFTNSYNIKIIGLLSLNSQMFHITLNGCRNVQIHGVKIIADRNSPNTDGIHLQLSSEVMIMNSTIKTGDDCIAIGPGTKNLFIQGIVCGPGHGISIGSLGGEPDEPGVQNVTVRSSLFIGTQNGVRIKTWAKPNNGLVQGIQFRDIIMRHVQNPILIDQNYCPGNINCPTQVSGIKISDVVYQGIRGTSATPIAIRFDCSPKYPCTGIKLQDVNLRCLKEATQSSCAYAKGLAFGKVQPKSCL